MKTLIKIFTISGLLLLNQGCMNDDDMIKIQKHDDNVMMKIMHSNMEKMMAMPMSKDPDDDFAMMMKMHHLAAVEMANAELKDGDNTQMKDMAQRIIAAQQAEIIQLDAFMAVHNPHMISAEFHEQMMNEMAESERQADLQVITGDIDHDFATLMIVHHHEAIENSRLELIYGHDSTMKTLANSIIKDQQTEIKVFQEWLLKNKPSSSMKH